MADEVAICNLALAHLGDEAKITSIRPPDGSAQAGHCAQFYPVARGVLLQMHPWTFATRRATLAPTANLVPDIWLYAYLLPAGCLRPLESSMPGTGGSVLLDNAMPQGWAFTMESNEAGDAILYTNAQTATLRYIALVTDTTKYSPLFTAALARLLAAYLAGPVLKSAGGRSEAINQLKLFEAEWRAAAVADANSARRASTVATPPWLAGRTLPHWPDNDPWLMR